MCVLGVGGVRLGCWKEIGSVVEVIKIDECLYVYLCACVGAGEGLRLGLNRKNLESCKKATEDFVVSSDKLLP